MIPESVGLAFNIFLSFLASVSFAAEDNKNVLAQHLVTDETNTAAMGELNQIINFDSETVCVKFSSAEGN